MSTIITAQMVSDLREKTGAGLLDCKKALTESNRHVEEAITILRKRGAASAPRRPSVPPGGADRELHPHRGQGRRHDRSELQTDFVRATRSSRSCAGPVPADCRGQSDLRPPRGGPEADLAKERDIASAQVQGKPPAAIQKIIEGKLEKYFSTVCLLDQPFVKQAEKSVKDIITEKVAKIGENIQSVVSCATSSAPEARESIVGVAPCSDG